MVEGVEDREKVNDGRSVKKWVKYLCQRWIEMIVRISMAIL